MVGINPFNPVPAKSFEQLSSQRKDKILGNVDLLLSAREYGLADLVLNYLSENGNYSDLAIKDRVLDMEVAVFIMHSANLIKLCKFILNCLLKCQILSLLKLRK